MELDVFEEMTRREPGVGLTSWDQVRADMDRGETLASHLWFPRGVPHAYDRVQEANRRGQTPERGMVSWDERPKPDELADDEVFHYANPMRRIIALHAHNDEMTGFYYYSPWPRADATTRRLG
jgi:hypothetical protein